jgi:hypothetical protein
MKRFALLATLMVVFAAPAGAVNDPFAPGNDCGSAAAIGDAAGANNQTPATAANPPFSLNNPGQSTGAKGDLNSPGVGCPAPNK